MSIFTRNANRHEIPSHPKRHQLQKGPWILSFESLELFRICKKIVKRYTPVKNSGIEKKNPPMAQPRVDAAPFKYLAVLEGKIRKMSKTFLWCQWSLLTITSITKNFLLLQLQWARIEWVRYSISNSNSFLDLVFSEKMKTRRNCWNKKAHHRKRSSLFGNGIFKTLSLVEMMYWQRWSTF